MLLLVKKVSIQLQNRVMSHGRKPVFLISATVQLHQQVKAPSDVHYLISAGKEKTIITRYFFEHYLKSKT